MTQVSINVSYINPQSRVLNYGFKCNDECSLSRTSNVFCVYYEQSGVRISSRGKKLTASFIIPVCHVHISAHTKVLVIYILLEYMHKIWQHLLVSIYVYIYILRVYVLHTYTYVHKYLCI